MSIDFDTARATVAKHINADYYSPDDELVILDDMTITKPYGWVFFFDSRLHVETGSFAYALGGNGPIVVEAESGELTELGTARAPEREIAAFEQKRGLSSGKTHDTRLERRTRGGAAPHDG